jgi:hypothetical protein
MFVSLIEDVLESHVVENEGLQAEGNSPSRLR